MCRVHVADPLRHWTQKQWKGKYRTDIKPLKIVQPEVRMEGGGARRCGAHRCNCTDAERATATLLVFCRALLLQWLGTKSSGRTGTFVSALRPQKASCCTMLASTTHSVTPCARSLTA